MNNINSQLSGQKTVRHKSQAFTLVELLIALFVFSMLSVFSFRAVGLLGVAQSETDNSMLMLASVQKAVLLWEKDMFQMEESWGAGSGEARSLDLSAQEAEFVFGYLRQLSGDGSKTGSKWYFLKNSSWFSANAGVDSGRMENSLRLLQRVKSLSIEEEMMGSPATGKSLTLTLLHEQFGLVKRVLYFPVGEPDKELGSLIFEAESGV